MLHDYKKLVKMRCPNPITDPVKIGVMTDKPHLCKHWQALTVYLKKNVLILV